ncbi:MAG: SusD/RagB family nutrient-binding outer membrane lipoprotein, partial [Bacteroidales bacterium]|nr:SusD/RagB family nutrient-binding outer membrane lipoprotein [Bacteroidales bacterium]
VCVSGSAKDYYEAGVKESFNQYGVGGVNDYLASDAVPADYINPVQPSWNIAAVNFLSPKWDDSASNEVKLERIIDQKYLAIYPDGYEAWTDLRRTGYPRQYPVIVNASSDLKDNEIVRRCTYPQSTISSDPTGYQQALGFLGGPDKASTRLWWDVDKANF